MFNNIVMAEDRSRTAPYGTVAQFPARINAALSSAAGDPQKLADAVLQIVQTPAGERKLRYRVSSAGLGVDEINAVTEQVQAQVLETFGFADEVRFVQRKAASST